MSKEQVDEKRKRLRHAFQTVFGLDGQRTPQQELVWDWFQKEIRARVFNPVRENEHAFSLDPIFAAVKDGRRQLCMEVEKLTQKDKDE